MQLRYYDISKIVFMGGYHDRSPPANFPYYLFILLNKYNKIN